MQTLELLERLVSFPTVSCNSNLDLITFVGDFLRARSFDVRLYENADGSKANLFATTGPRDRPGVALSGHTDVVPVDGQMWSSDPFRLREHERAYYGRGAADMKGFIACALSAADRASGLKLRSPLHIALSYDEEIGCIGVRSLIQDMQSWMLLPRLCIVGEPTSMCVGIGHKGKTAMKVTCTGHAAHSALAPRGLNAIYLASDLIQRLREVQASVQTSGAREAGYDIPYSTLHVGRIEGGLALNVVPERCQLEVEIRTVAAEQPASYLESIQGMAADIGRRSSRADAAGSISIEVTNEYPGLSVPADSPVVRFVGELAGEAARVHVAFGSEAGLFSRIGIPAVLCGPGSIEQAHRADEFVTADQLAKCDAMMQRLLDRLQRDTVGDVL